MNDLSLRNASRTDHTGAPAAQDSRVPLLDVRDLYIAFPGHLAVRGISFQIRRGETLALVGESGCGKSATSLAIMQLLPRGTKLSGQVMFSGTDLIGADSRMLEDVRGKRIGLIMQEPMTALNPVLTIGDQIAEGLIRHEGLTRNLARKRTVELLDLVRIPEPHQRYDDYPHNMSGGQRQRVMIAMAVACNPEMVIADEPTTALDVTLQSEVLELLDNLRTQLRMALLLITHDLGVVAQWADRVAVMYAGNIVETAETNTLFHNPVHPYSRGLMGSTLRLEDGGHYTTGNLYEIPGSIASAAGEKGCAFAPRCSEALSRCRLAPPALLPLPDHRLAACHLASTLQKDVIHAVS